MSGVGTSEIEAHRQNDFILVVLHFQFTSEG